MISYIVSVYQGTGTLRACLASLSIQRRTSSITVCDNGSLHENLAVCREFEAAHIDTGSLGAINCYESANMAAPQATGEWLCFPSDDSLYVSDFSKIMLATAEREKADFVYCDCVYKQGSINGNWPPYSVLETQPKIGRIDKTCFIVRREKFHGFPPHQHDYRDGALVEELVRQGVRHAKAPGVLAIHQ